MEILVELILKYIATLDFNNLTTGNFIVLAIIGYYIRVIRGKTSTKIDAKAESMDERRRYDPGFDAGLQEAQLNGCRNNLKHVKDLLLDATNEITARDTIITDINVKLNDAEKEINKLKKNTYKRMYDNAINNIEQIKEICDSVK